MSVKGLDALQLLDRVYALAPAELRAEASRALEQGLLLHRLWAPGVVFAVWNAAPDVRSVIRARENGFTLACSCPCTPEQPFCVHLTALALAWIYDSASFKEEAPARFLSRSDGPDLTTTQPEAKDLAGEYYDFVSLLRVADIRDAARQLDIHLKTGLNKEELSQALAAALAAPETLARLYGRLSERAQRLLDFMTLAFPRGPIVGGDRFLENVARALGGKAEDYHGALQELIDALFVFGASSDWAPHWRFAAHLRPALPQGPAWVPVYARGRSLHVETIMPQQGDGTILQLLLLVQAHPQLYRLRKVQLAEDDWVTKLGLDRLSYSEDSQAELQAAVRSAQLRPDLHLRLAAPAPVLADDSFKQLAGELGIEGERLDFLLRLLLQEELLFAGAGYLQPHPSGSLFAYLKLPQEGRVVRLARAYMDLEWSDFYRVLQDRGGLGIGLRAHHFLQQRTAGTQFFSGPRKFLWYLLYRAPSGQWLDVQALTDYLAACVPAQALGLDEQVFSLEWNQKALTLSRKEDWARVYNALLAAVLEGPARWLGLVEIGYVEEKLVAFRLTALGEALLERPFTLPPVSANQDRPAIHFTADGDILADLSVCPEPVLRLLAFLPVRNENGRAVYCFVPGALPVYLDEEGWTMERIIAALEQASGGPLPPVLRQKLDLWQQNFGRAQFYPTVALIELGDDYALPELLATTDLARYLVYQFGPRLVAVNPTGVPILQRQMIANGHTPRVVQK